MTKSQLIALLAEKTSSIPRTDVETCVRTILTTMSKYLGNGERIEIRDFGSFDSRTRQPKDGPKSQNGRSCCHPWEMGCSFQAREGFEGAGGSIVAIESISKFTPPAA